MSDTKKHVKGNKKDISIQERYYAQEEKINRLTELVSILWQERTGHKIVTRGLGGVIVKECLDGDYTFEKPKHLDCGTLSEDMGCEILDEKPETVQNTGEE